MRALALLTLCGCISLESRGLPKKNPEFLVVGHRGAPLAAAENTIPSYRAAIELGASAVELDLCVTLDGVAVVWHDADPDDTVARARQNGLEGLPYVPVVPPEGSPFHRPVAELTLAELLATHGYARRGESQVDRGAVIPTLADVLAWAAGEPALQALYLDLKVDTAAAAIAILEEVQAAGLTATVYALSVHEDVVVGLSRETDGVRVVWDFESSGALEGAERHGLRDVSLGLTPLRTESDVLSEIEDIAAARKDRRIDTVTVWTIDAPLQMALYLYAGVDAVMTNDPARLYEIWQATL